MKKAYIVIGIILLVVGTIVSLKLNKKSNKSILEVTEEESNWWNEDDKNMEEIIKKNYVSVDMIIEMTKSKPDWSKIDILKENLEKIKKKYPNGIFDGEEYENIELKEDYKVLIHDSEMGGDTFVLIATKGNIKVEYTVWGEFGDVLSKDRFSIYTVLKKVLTDDEGNSIKYPMDEDNWILNLQKLSLKDDKEVGRSERFDLEHKDFTGLLNPYNEDERDITINTIVDECDFEKKVYVCEIHYHHRYLYVTYKINYTVDNNNYIDRINIEELSTREQKWKNDYDKLLDSTGIAIKVLLKNRSMDNVPFSNNLLDKLNNGLINYDIIWFRCIKYNEGQKNNKNLYRIVLANGDIKYIGLKYFIIDNQIDDIIVKELPITEETFKNYSTKELYDMF